PAARWGTARSGGGDCGGHASPRRKYSKRRGAIMGSRGWTSSNSPSSKRAATFRSFRSEKASLATTTRRHAGISRAWPPSLRKAKDESHGSSVPLLRLRRRLARRHDLIGGAAHEFGHVIELEGEAADAGGGRAHLHDEIADLRFRHLHAHHVPAVPTLTGIEAEDLAAPSRHQRVHLGGRLRRTDD